MMQVQPSCARWRAFIDALGQPPTSDAALAFPGCPRLGLSMRGVFKRAATRHFADCCVERLSSRLAASVARVTDKAPPKASPRASPRRRPKGQGGPMKEPKKGPEDPTDPTPSALRTVFTALGGRQG